MKGGHLLHPRWSNQSSRWDECKDSHTLLLILLHHLFHEGGYEMNEGDVS